MSKWLLRAGQLIDGTGSAPRRDVELLVADGRIAAIGPRGQLPAEGAKVIPAEGQAILPGLIDAHVHICSDPDPDPTLKERYEPLEMMTVRGARNCRLTLEGGITTIRTLGTPKYIDLALRDGIKAGLIPGPRIVAGGMGITITGGHGWYYRIEADGVDGMRKAARRDIREGVNVIKLTVTGGVMTPGIRPGVPKMNRDEIEAVVVEAHKQGIKVAGHAEGKQGVNDAIAVGIDSIEHGYFQNNEEGIRLMLEHGTWLVPTIMAYDLIAKGIDAGVPPEAVENAQMALEYNTVGFRRAVEAGVKVAMGSDAGTAFNDHGQSWRELIFMVQHGMTPMQAIVAATAGGAELLGLDREIGTLEPGKRADIIVVDGDPLARIAEIGNVTCVMQNGVVVKGA